MQGFTIFVWFSSTFSKNIGFNHNQINPKTFESKTLWKVRKFFLPWLTNVTCWLLESSFTRYLNKIGETKSSTQDRKTFLGPGPECRHYDYHHNSFSQGNSLIIHESTNECMHQQLVVITGGDDRGEMVADKTLVIHTWLDRQVPKLLHTIAAFDCDQTEFENIDVN